MKLPILASFFFILFLTVLCALGVWQLHRLEWKRGLIAALDAEYAKDAAKSPLSASDLEGDFLFRRGTLRGVYEFGKEIRLGPRVYDGRPGWHVITPLRLKGGSYVLVNRGWAPQDWSFANETQRPENEITLTGLLRKPADHNAFTPDNRPDKGEWFYVDAAQIAAAKKLGRVSPYVFYPDPPMVFKDYPLPPDSRPQFPNDHLQYAIFWFTMAGVLTAVFALRFIRKA